MQTLRRNLLIGFVIGALVPLFWGVLGFLLFNIPEGPLSRIFWGAVYLTCPFWVIAGNKALILMPVLKAPCTAQSSQCSRGCIESRGNHNCSRQ